MDYVLRQGAAEFGYEPGGVVEFGFDREGGIAGEKRVRQLH